MAIRYLYLRTNLELQYSKDVISTLDTLGDYSPEIFGIGKFRLLWRDGIALRFESSQTPKAICRWLGPKLARFEAWACHDGANRCHDYPLGAQTSTFFEGLGSRLISQLFVEYNKDDFRQEALIDKLKGILEHNAKAKCRSVFDFRNGKILLIAANEPQRTTFRRCQDCLKDRLRYGFIDADGDIHSALGLVDDEAAWGRLRFDEISNPDAA